MLKNYRRVFALHVTALHVMIVVAANDDRFELRFVSTAAVTYACYMAFCHLVSLWLGRGSRAKKVLPCVLHLAVAAVFFIEFAICGNSAELLGGKSPQPTRQPDGTWAYPECYAAVASSNFWQRLVYAHNLTSYEQVRDGHLPPSRAFLDLL